jgi:hypothetical protein
VVSLGVICGWAFPVGASLGEACQVGCRSDSFFNLAQFSRGCHPRGGWAFFLLRERGMCPHLHFVRRKCPPRARTRAEGARDVCVPPPSGSPRWGEGR